MDKPIPILPALIVIIILTIFTAVWPVMAYYAWFDYQKIPQFMGDWFPNGPIDHKKAALSSMGKFFWRLMSLIGLCFSFFIWVSTVIQLIYDFANS